MEISGDRSPDVDTERPSASAAKEALGMQSIASFVARRAVQIAVSESSSSAAAENVAALCTPTGQEQDLLDFLDKARPFGVEVDRWLDWYVGGAPPVKARSVDRPIGETRSPAELLDRRVKQTSKLEQRIAAAKRAQAETAKQIEVMESDLLAVRSTNAAVLQFAYFERMMEIVRSNPAVGPMWTFARAISATDMHDNTDVATLSDARRQLYEAALVKRREDTDTIFAALDFMCGDMRFEDQLRNAILHLIEAVEPEIEKRRASGHKARPLTKVRTTMAASSADEVRQVLDGLPQI